MALALAFCGDRRHRPRPGFLGRRLPGRGQDRVRPYLGREGHDKGRDYNRVRIDIEQRLKRRDDEAVIKLMYGTIETLDGEVLRLDTRTQAGETQDIRVHGDVINHQMKLTMDGDGPGRDPADPLGTRCPRAVRRRAEHGAEADEGA